jgi:2-dehydropantoate 2-reductase
MKVLVIGMGNVGTMHGWALSQAGADITHVVRKGTKSLFEDGVRMDVLDLRGDSPRHYDAVYLPRVVEEVSPTDGHDLVMVATNQLQAAYAVRQYRDLVPAYASFLMFTANWDGTGEIDALLPRPRYLWGYSVCSGARGGDGTLYANVQRTYRIGEIDGSSTPRLESIIKTFGEAGLAADIKPNIIEWLWVHHAINAGMIGATIYTGGLPTAEVGIDVWVLMVRATKDALAVLEKRGVAVRAYADTEPFLGPDDEEVARSLRKAWLSAPHYERTRQHGHFGSNPAEMRQFYLDVLRTGERLGVPLPCLESLKERVCA